jgi:hypothetical protein
MMMEEEERDNMISGCGGEGWADSGDGMEADGVAAASKKKRAREILAA